ncbi:MAG: helix-turn-helix transcriptional regulator [Lachnospiraceae bacterium]|nr:helix-turn-helix transcriptional regulator [Lachnospiraceae bacterium]
MKISKTKTTELLRMIQDCPKDFEKRIQKESFEELSLQEYLLKLLEKKGKSASSIVTASLMSKSYVYQILSGERHPSRDVLIRIGYALHCDVDEMQHLLIHGGFAALYPKVRRDAAILCCLSKDMELTETDSFLEEIGEKNLIQL